jgi:hypothetical protein
MNSVAHPANGLKATPPTTPSSSTTPGNTIGAIAQSAVEGGLREAFEAGITRDCMYTADGHIDSADGHTDTVDSHTSSAGKTTCKDGPATTAGGVEDDQHQLNQLEMDAIVIFGNDLAKSYNQMLYLAGTVRVFW